MVVVRRARGKTFFKDWKDWNDDWGRAVERNMGKKVEVDRASEQVDVRRLKQDGRGWGLATRAFNGRKRVGQGANSCSTELT